MVSDYHKAIIAVLLTTAFLSYSFYLYSNLPEDATGFTSEMDRGKELWQKHNCIACHQVYGLGGYLGPDLTNEYSLRGPEVIKAFLKAGTITMPAFHLTEEETTALLAYLQHTDKTGIADPRSYKIYANGTIDQE